MSQNSGTRGPGSDGGRVQRFAGRGPGRNSRENNVSSQKPVAKSTEQSSVMPFTPVEMMNSLKDT